METKDKTKLLLGVLMALVVISSIISTVMINEVANREVKLDTSSLETSLNSFSTAVSSKLDTIDSKITAPTSSESNDSPVVIGSYTLTKKEFESEITEAKALELTNAYIESKDFKKLFEDKDYNASTEMKYLGIKDYKDITNVKVIKTDFDMDSNSVTYKIKVYFDVDGDDDDKAYITLKEFSVEVSGLDYDDEFVDAEVDEDAVEDELMSDLSDSGAIKVKYYD